MRSVNVVSTYRVQFIHLLCQCTSPIILTSLFSNWSLIFAKAPSSVVHTGVKSAGWEKKIAQLPPSHWWKSMSPCVVFALKFGASVPIRNRGCSAGVARYLRKTGDACRLAKEDCVAERRGSCDVARRALRVRWLAIVTYKESRNKVKPKVVG